MSQLFEEYDKQHFVRKNETEREAAPPTLPHTNTYIRMGKVPFMLDTDKNERVSCDDFLFLQHTHIRRKYQEKKQK